MYKKIVYHTLSKALEAERYNLFGLKICISLLSLSTFNLILYDSRLSISHIILFCRDSSTELLLAGLILIPRTATKQDISMIRYSNTVNIRVSIFGERFDKKYV